ncbi:MAG: hypothetical protein ACE5JI_05440, partial [Acidobacteriota bacterium]
TESRFVRLPRTSVRGLLMSDRGSYVSRHGVLIYTATSMNRVTGVTLIMQRCQVISKLDFSQQISHI